MIEAYATPRADFGGAGYVVNQVDQSRQLTKDVLKVLRHMLGDKLFPGVIHLDEGVSESLACDTTLIHYDPLSQAAADFRACGEWLTQRGRFDAALAEERRMSKPRARALSEADEAVAARTFRRRALLEQPRSSRRCLTLFALVMLYFVFTVPLAFTQQLTFACCCFALRAGVPAPAAASTRRS